MQFAACVVPAAALRRSPAHESEMVNQLLFGETMQIIETGSALWSQVRTIPGNYEGWINKLQIEIIDEDTAGASFEVIDTLNSYNEILFDGSPMIIPFGASLINFANGKGQIGSLNYECDDKDTKAQSLLEAKEEKVKSILEKWVNTPYLWGGRTMMGVDCSGLTQVVFKMIGIDLLRDASQQATQGEPIDFLQQARVGDLAFFDDDAGNIYHVGILLGSDRIIHASGKVRIDSIDTAGIINMQNGLRTHRLRIIKRYF